MTAWKPLPRDSRYEISDDGQVRSNCRKHRRSPGHLMHQSTMRSGHMRVTIGRRTMAVHRLVLEAFVGPCPPGMQCRHLNDVPNDNRLENLAWGTPKENAEDCLRNGRRSDLGASHRSARLTVDSVRAIRNSTANASELAPIYGVSVQAISNARRYDTWAHVDPENRPAPAPKCGATYRCARLTEADVRMIRASSESMYELARRLGVSDETVREARVGKTWRHVT